MVLNPNVAVRLKISLLSSSSAPEKLAYVGKKLTKLRPRSCEQVITAKIETLISFIASFNPDHILRKLRLSL